MDKISKNDWKEYYSILGEFVVTFESIVDRIRDECVELMKRRGLKDLWLGDIIFGQKTFTAFPLLECFVSMVNHIIKRRRNSKLIIDRLKDFNNKFIKQIEMRNNILHAPHFLVQYIYTNTKSKVEEFNFRAHKTSPNKSGLVWKEIPKQHIVESNKKLMELNDEFIKLTIDLHQYLDSLKLS